MCRIEPAFVPFVVSAGPIAVDDAELPERVATPQQAPRALKLWDLEHKFHCPVIGTCLSFDELKKIARKAGYGGRQFEEYDLHVEAVGIAESRNAISKAMQKLLDQKYARWLNRFAEARTPERLLELWREHRDRGEVAGALWAIMTHRAADPDTRHLAYRDVHMLSHQVGAGIAADVRRRGDLERENAALRQEAVRTARQYADTLAERDAQIREQQQELKTTRRALVELERLRSTLAALESGAALRELRTQVAEQAEALAKLQLEAQRVARLEDAHQALLEAHASVQQQAETLREERDALERLMTPASPCSTCDHSELCSDIDLAGRSVLCVGGRTAVFAQYREVVERFGGRFMLHDGGREENLARLPELLNAADAVICAADCVSHNAYYRLKRHCKQSQKPCVMLKHSGLAGFAAGVARLAMGRAEIGARGN
ncbi:MAG: DUF2325 domain-containing protein [Thiotrichales bacterium]